MRVALDLEGVLADIHGRFLDHYNQEFGTDFSREDITHWGFGRVRQHFEQVNGASGETEFLEGSGEWKGFHGVTREFWRKEPLSIPALGDDLSMQLSRLENRTDIVTARTGARDGIERWLREKGIEPHYSELRIESDKHRLDYDVFIDDKPALHRELSGLGKIGIIVDQPWNRDVEADFRADSFYHAVEVVRDLG